MFFFAVVSELSQNWVCTTVGSGGWKDGRLTGCWWLVMITSLRLYCEIYSSFWSKLVGFASHECAGVLIVAGEEVNGERLENVVDFSESLRNLAACLDRWDFCDFSNFFPFFFLIFPHFLHFSPFFPIIHPWTSCSTSPIFHHRVSKLYLRRTIN